MLDSDPEKQASLRRLLIEEEDKPANDRERLENCERLVARGGSLVREGGERLKRLSESGASNNTREQHQRTLGLMAAIQQLFENFRRCLLTEYPYSVRLRDKTVAVCATLNEARGRIQRFVVANPEAVVAVVDASNGRTEIRRTER